MKIPRVLAIAIIGAAVITAAAIGLRSINEEIDPPEAVPPVSTTLPFQTEEAWSVLQIAQHIADLAVVATNPSEKLEPVRVTKLASVGGECV